MFFRISTMALRVTRYSRLGVVAGGGTRHWASLSVDWQAGQGQDVLSFRVNATLGKRELIYCGTGSRLAFTLRRFEYIVVRFRSGHQ